jgi:hypothetical protein
MDTSCGAVVNRVTEAQDVTVDIVGHVVLDYCEASAWNVAKVGEAAEILLLETDDFAHDVNLLKFTVESGIAL